VESLRILIADDETIIVMDLKARLERLGHRVVGDAVHGLQALQMARELQPDLIIMDIKMPRLNGIEAARTITQESPAPIIFLTAYGDEELARQASRVGAQAYLVKPVADKHLVPAITLAYHNFRQLLAFRKRLASTPCESASPHSCHEPILRIFTLGRFTIQRGQELISKEAWSVGKAGARKARALLAYLLSRQPYGASRDEILELFWPMREYEIARGSFNRTLYALRRALEPALKTRQTSTYILQEQEIYSLNMAQIWLDKDAFQTHLQQGTRWWARGLRDEAYREWQEADRLYRGDWLKGVPGVENWCTPLRQQLRMDYVHLQFSLADAAERQGDFSRALLYSQKALEQDPFDEAINERLIRTYLRLGRFADAVDQQRFYEARCQDLDISPAPDLLRRAQKLPVD